MNDKMQTITKRPTLAILVVISMGGTLAMNIILPSLPGIQKTFHTDYATVQLTLTLFLAGLAIAQLIYGPLSDRFGRRPIALYGLVILFVGTGICFLADSIEVMIFGRIVQAVGGCAGIVIGRAMVRDLYDMDRAAAMIAYLTMATVVAPTLAPLIGGYLEEWFSWSASFVFILIVTAMSLIAAFFAAHETLPPSKRHEGHFLQMFSSFRHLLGNSLFAGYASQVGFSTAAYFAFLGGSPFVMINLMGGSPAELGLYFAVVSVFYISGNYGTAQFAKKVGVHRMVKIGTLVALAGALSMLTVVSMVGLTPVTFFGIMCVLAFGNGICISSGMAAAISADPERVGAAAGLAGSMQIGFSAVSSFIGGVVLAYYETTAVPLLVVMVICCVLAVASPLLRKRTLSQV
jgi:MFS transporter, DHA1 family, multidrug resistance protein